MRRVLAAVSAVAIAVGGAIAFAGPSTAQNQVGVGGLEDKGTITLRTGLSSSSNKIEYKDADGNAVGTQAIIAGCPASVEAGALTITASPGSLCFGNLGFGVGPGGSPFYLNPNVTAGESLTLSLSGPAGDFEITSFSLDIEASNLNSGQPDIEVTAKRDGTAVETFTIDLTQRVPGVLLPNYRVDQPLVSPADELVLTALGTTRFQLEGDTSNTGSIFTLTDITDVVPCDGSATSNGAQLTLDGGEGCTAEPVFFEFENNEVTLLKDPSDASFTLVVPWVDSAEDAAYPGRTTQIDYFDGVDTSGDSDPFDPMVFCDPTTTPPTLPGDQIPGTAAEDGWCVGDRQIPVDNGNGTSTTVETLYGFGDPKFK